jgi:hypothetical protein
VVDDAWTLDQLEEPDDCEDTQPRSRVALTGLSWSEYYVALRDLYGPVRGATKSPTMARVYADVNAQMPRAYWDYDSVNISWGALENYEVVKKIGQFLLRWWFSLTGSRKRQILGSF